MRYQSLLWLMAPVCLSTMLTGLGATRHTSAAEPAVTRQDIEKWITDLGDDRFEVREAATHQLMEHEESIPALRQALKSRDAEVGRRARDILDYFVRREKQRAFARFKDLAEHGQVDQAVETLVRREKWDNEGACWQVIADLADKLTDLERITYGRSSLSAYDVLTETGFSRLVEAFQLKIVPTDLKPLFWKRRIVLRAQEISSLAAIGKLLPIAAYRARRATTVH